MKSRLNESIVPFQTIISNSEVLQYTSPTGIRVLSSAAFNYSIVVDENTPSPPAEVFIRITPESICSGSPPRVLNSSPSNAPFVCLNGAWVLNTTRLTISTSTLPFTVASQNSSIVIVSGCIDFVIGSTLDLRLTADEYRALTVQNSRVSISLLESLSACLSAGGFTSVTITCGNGESCGNCLAEQIINSRALAILFTSSCNSVIAPPDTFSAWWIAVAVVGGALVLTLIGLGIAAKKSERVRNCIFPWRHKQDESRNRMTQLD